MFGPFYEATMLAFESNAVIAMRTMKMAVGGRDAWVESQLMVQEKVDAAIESVGMMTSGASVTHVIARYREHVAANASRLSTRI